MRLTNAKRSNLNASRLVLVSGRQVTFAGNPFLRFRSVLDFRTADDSLFCPGTVPRTSQKICSGINHAKGKHGWRRQREATLKVMRFK